MDTDYMKCVLIGDGAVGKTSLLLTYVRKGFPTKYEPTVMDNYQVSIPVRNRMLTVDVWDTAGQETFDAIRALSYPNCDVFVICYSCVSRTSLENVKNLWYPEMRRTPDNKDVPFVLVGTKVDLTIPGPNMAARHEIVSKEEADVLCKRLGGYQSYQCSALQGLYVEDVFKGCIKCVMEKRMREQSGCCCVVL